MAAPVPTPRGTPAGITLKDGYRCLITHSSNPTIAFQEKLTDFKPPGMDGGEPIDISVQQNNRWRTREPRSLKDLTPQTVRVAYDPINYDGNAGHIASLINVKGTITHRWRDGSTLAYYGYFQKFEPDAMQEGKQPEGMLTVVPTNLDPVNNVEADPVLTNVAGS